MRLRLESDIFISYGFYTHANPSGLSAKKLRYEVLKNKASQGVTWSHTLTKKMQTFRVKKERAIPRSEQPFRSNQKSANYAVFSSSFWFCLRVLRACATALAVSDLNDRY
jgi:hypothetical protein